VRSLMEDKKAEARRYGYVRSNPAQHRADVTIVARFGLFVFHKRPHPRIRPNQIGIKHSLAFLLDAIDAAQLQLELECRSSDAEADILARGPLPVQHISGWDQPDQTGGLNMNIAILAESAT